LLTQQRTDRLWGPPSPLTSWLKEKVNLSLLQGVEVRRRGSQFLDSVLRDGSDVKPMPVTGRGSPHDLDVEALTIPRQLAKRWQ
jgi:hypothetical protein